VGPGTVADKPLDAGAVLALDAHGGIDAEPTGALPGEHVVRVGFVEEAAASEQSQDAALHGGFEVLDVLGAHFGGLVEPDVMIAPWERTANKPSRTTRWKWGWTLREEPDHASRGAHGRS
jgi:hypothetical protein